MKGKFEEAMADTSRPKPAQAMIKYAQIILNILLFSGIVFFVLYCVAVAAGWI